MTPGTASVVARRVDCCTRTRSGQSSVDAAQLLQRITQIALVLLATVCLGTERVGAQTEKQIPRPITPDVMLRHFEETAVIDQTITWPDGTTQVGLAAKWTVPIRVSVLGPATDRQNKEIDRFIENIAYALIIGKGRTKLIDIERTQSKEANVLIFIDHDFDGFKQKHEYLSQRFGRGFSDFERAFDEFRENPKAGCLRSSPIKDRKLEFGVILIRSKLNEYQFMKCVHAGILQVLGLINTPRTYPSVLQERSAYYGINILDALTLRILYHENMAAFDNKEGAMINADYIVKNVNFFTRVYRNWQFE